MKRRHAPKVVRWIGYAFSALILPPITGIVVVALFLFYGDRNAAKKSAIVTVVALLIVTLAVVGKNSDAQAATIKRCGNVTGSYVTARNLTVSRGTQCQFARLVFFNWEASSARVPGRQRLNGYSCRSSFIGESIAVNCVSSHGFFIRWRTPIEGEN